MAEPQSFVSGSSSSTKYTAFSYSRTSQFTTSTVQLAGGLDGLFEAMLQLADRPPPEPVKQPPAPQSSSQEVTSADDSDANEPVAADDDETTEQTPDSTTVAAIPCLPVVTPVATDAPAEHSGTALKDEQPIDAAKEVVADASTVPTTNVDALTNADVPATVTEDVVDADAALTTSAPTETVTATDTTTTTDEIQDADAAIDSAPVKRIKSEHGKGDGPHRGEYPQTEPVKLRPDHDTEQHQHRENQANIELNPSKDAPDTAALQAVAPESQGGDGRTRGEPRRWSVGGESTFGGDARIGQVDSSAQTQTQTPRSDSGFLNPVTDPAILAAATAQAEQVAQTLDAALPAASTNVANAGVAAAAVSAVKSIDSSSNTGGGGLQRDFSGLNGAEGLLGRGRAANNSTATSDTSESPDSNPSSQIDRAKLVQRVSKAFNKIGANGGTVRVRLHPPDLGAIKVEVQIEGKSIRATLTAESEAARSAVQEQIPDLRQKLAEQGIRVDRIQVETESNQSNFNLNSDARQQQQAALDYSDSQRRSRSPEYATNLNARQTTTPLPVPSAIRTTQLGQLDLRA